MREIQGHRQELYGIEVSPELVSTVTDAVLEEVTEWQNRPLEPLYAIVFFTTNAIESLHGTVRRSVRTRGHFPSDESAMKLIWLVLRNVTADWKMPPQEWHAAKAQFAIAFGDRFTLTS